MHIGRIAILSAIAALPIGCATTTAVPGGDPQLTVLLTEGLAPIADVDGPYGAVAVKDHTVAVRVWPDGLGDGLADFSVIVTNQSWNTVILDPADISVIAEQSGELDILDRDSMLALVGTAESPDQRASIRNPGSLSEQRSSRASRAADGAMGGTRMSGDIGSTAVDPALVAAARSVPGAEREAGPRVDEATLAEQRAAIEAWYLHRVEIYPGDTAAGGISFRLPLSSDELSILVRLSGDTYSFRLRFDKGD